MAGKPRYKRRSARNAQRLKKKFLEAYSRLGNATAAQDATGINRFLHIRWLKQSAEYRKAFEQAEDAATEMLEKEALRRAVEGREEPVYYCGDQIGTVRKYSDLLLIFLLKAKKPDVYRERYDARLTANLNVQSAVKVVHEYHPSSGTIDVTTQDVQPNKQLMSATTSSEIQPGHVVLTEHKVGTGADSPQQKPATLKVPVPCTVPATEPDPSDDTEDT